MKKILLTDNVVLNGGDAAILLATFNGIKSVSYDSQASFVIHCDYYNQAISRYENLPLKRSLSESVIKFPPAFFWRFGFKHRFRSLKKLLLSMQERQSVEDYHDADIVISCGGSFLTDAYDINQILLGYDLALSLKKDVYVIGQSIGPFNCHRARDEVSKRLRHFKKIVVRDNRSYQEALSMGVDEDRLIEARDMAFNLSPVPREIGNRAMKVVGISVRKWSRPGLTDDENRSCYEKYINTMADVCTSLISEHNLSVKFLSTCQGDDAYSFKDNFVAKDIVSLVGEEYKSKINVCNFYCTPDRFFEELDEVDFFIGTRMHACIMSMLKNIPTINISYEFKSVELFNSMGLHEYVLDIATIEAEKLLSTFSILRKNYSHVAGVITEKISEFREINKLSFSRLNLFDSIG